jgi:exopolyphosphatase/guanosine-5'-triphosphate,3'-diphosphate pyrophosphatase
VSALPVDSALGARALAAIDLGSNSFHMVVARDVDGQPVIIDRLRDHVRLAAGLTQDHRLSKNARRRGIESLRRFGQRIRDFAADSVRAVATNTLRVARNGRAFLDEAAEALGHPIEVISGREEARLIYLGVSHTLSNDDLGCRLVLDIGGGSTECRSRHARWRRAAARHPRASWADSRLDG